MTILYLPLLLVLAASARLEDLQPAALLPMANPVAARELQPDAASDESENSTTASELSDWQAGLSLETSTPNEIPFGRGTADGIFIQLFTTDNPLELINPAAPERYGSPNDNTVQDITSQKPSGLKLLEFRF